MSVYTTSKLKPKVRTDRTKQRYMSIKLLKLFLNDGKAYDHCNEIKPQNLLFIHWHKFVYESILVLHVNFHF